MLNLGPFSLSLAVSNLDVSLDFYQKLGFTVIDGGHSSQDFPDSERHRWRVVKNGDTTLGLFQGMFQQNVLTFTPKDVRAIQRALREQNVPLSVEASESGSGPANIMLQDPDGNPILLDQR